MHGSVRRLTTSWKLKLVATFVLALASATLEAATSAPSAIRTRVPLSRAAAVAPASVSHTGVLRNDRLLIRVQPALRASEAVTVVTRGADRAGGTTNVLRPSTGAVEVALQTNKQYVVFSSAASRRIDLAQGKNVFPGTLVVGTPSAQTRAGQLFLEPRQSPLPWNSEAKSYLTTLVVGLDLTNQTVPMPLQPPVTVQFFASHAGVEPPSVTIERTGTTGYREVRLSCRKYQGNPSVTARSDLGELTQAVPVEDLGLLALIEIIFPLPFLFAALLGGGLGGFLRAFRQSPGSWKRIVRRVAEGCLVGVLVVGALSVGIAVGNFSPAVVGRELGAFVIAGLAGYVGTAVLDKLAKTVFKTDEAAAKGQDSDAT
jgi:hypothetical protein